MSKPRIGSRREAMTLLDTVDSHVYSGPDGWEVLGSGCFRTAYLAPSGIVYKIGEASANLSESRKSALLRKRTNLPDFLYIPVVSAFSFQRWRTINRYDYTLEKEYTVREERREVVSAMEYIEGDHLPYCFNATWTDEPEVYCSCGEYGDYNGDYYKGVPLCDVARTLDTIKRAVHSSDVHNENVIRMTDGRIAFIDMQM